MKTSNEEIQQKISQIKKDYTLLFFGFLVTHCYISTLMTTRVTKFLIGTMSSLTIFFWIGFYFVIYFFLKWNFDMNSEINDVINKNEEDEV